MCCRHLERYNMSPPSLSAVHAEHIDSDLCLKRTAANKSCTCGVIHETEEGRAPCRGTKCRPPRQLSRCGRLPRTRPLPLAARTPKRRTAAPLPLHALGKAEGCRLQEGRCCCIACAGMQAGTPAHVVQKARQAWTTDSRLGTSLQAQAPGPQGGWCSYTILALVLQKFAPPAQKTQSCSHRFDTRGTPVGLAQPKSMSAQLCSCGRRRMLPGFKSLCTTPAACSACSDQVGMGHIAMHNAQRSHVPIS